MSGVIWGYIDLQTNINQDFSNIKKCLLNYKVDFVREECIKNCYMGAGILDITQENSYEILPFYDKEAKVLITVDAIIDNRKELIELLNIDDEKITDSQIILNGYKKWEGKVVEKLLGDFSFTIYDFEKEQVYSARDHLGCRTFYYYHDENIFVFATLMDMVIEMIRGEVSINQRWLGDFIYLNSVAHQTEERETIYNEILQLPRACILRIESKEERIDEYWNPFLESEFKSKKDWLVEFKALFNKVVKCRLRSKYDISATLSAGLDSSAVTCTAAKILSDEKKMINAYTSIPLKQFSKVESEYSIYDETNYVKEVEQLYSNINLELCDSKGKSPLSDIEENLKIIEHPYKVVGNIYWLKEIIRKTRKNNSRVLLVGQLGNSTISYGDINTYVKTMIRRGKLKRVIKESDRFKKKYRLSNKSLFKIYAKFLVPDNILRKRYLAKIKNIDILKQSFIKEKFANKIDVQGRMIASELYAPISICNDWKKSRELIIKNNSFCQIGELETKVGLKEGIIIRDPTKDKRIFEFCMRAPIEEFYKNGENRRLIRRAMNGIIPDSIRLNYCKRGVQSSDFVERVQEEKKLLIEYAEYILKSEISKKYFDREKINTLSIRIKNNLENVRDVDIAKIIYLYGVTKFLTCYELNSKDR